MATRPFIPEHLEQLTPEWFTEVLRERGVVDRARVVAASHEILGDGEGFLGVIARMTLTYDLDEPSAPRSLVAKLPQAANRAMGEMMGAYERESLFYEELAPQVPLRMPRVFYSAFDRDRGSEQQQKILAFVDRLPVSLSRSTLGAGRWIAGRKKRRYILLMEDLASSRSGDHVAGGSLDDCRSVLVAVAAAHAAFWGAEALKSQFWIVPQSLDTRMRYGMFRQHRDEFVANHPELLAEGLGRATDWLYANGLEVTRKLFCARTETIVHCDLRLDNVFFDDGADESVIFFDWQLVRRGPAAYDVAYFLCGALAPDTSAEDEAELLHAYHGALVEAGVKDYEFDVLLGDYRRSLLAVLQTLSTTGTMEMGSERGVDLMNRWIERLAGRLRAFDYDELL